MKFVCTQENLLDGLTQVGPVAGRNAQLPILKNVLMRVREGVLHLTSTDLEVGVHSVVGGKAEGSGSVAVSARQFLEYVQQLPSSNPIELETDKRGLVVSTEGFRAAFAVADPEEFPLLPEVGEGREVELSAQQFCSGLSSVMFAAAREETRPEIHSVYITASSGEIRMAATDSFRLSERVLSVDGDSDDFSFLLPLTAAQEIVRLFNDKETITLLPRDNTVAFHADGLEFSTRLVDGSYPDYQQIIPDDLEVSVQVGREALLRACKTLTVFLPRDSRRIRLSAQPSKSELVVEVETSEVGEGVVRLPIEGSGKDVDVLLNVQYLLDGISHISSSDCSLLLGGPDRPVVFKPGEGESGYVYVVMPIQA